MERQAYQIVFNDRPKVEHLRQQFPEMYREHK